MTALDADSRRPVRERDEAIDMRLQLDIFLDSRIGHDASDIDVAEVQGPCSFHGRNKMNVHGIQCDLPARHPRLHALELQGFASECKPRYEMLERNLGI